MTAAEKYTAIVDALLAGRTVYLSTAYTCRWHVAELETATAASAPETAADSPTLD